MKKIGFTSNNLKRVLCCSIIMLIMASCYGPIGKNNAIPLTPEDSYGATSLITQENIRLYVDFERYEASENLALDLETGLLTKSIDADIEFAVSRGGGGLYFYFLQPINGARANFVSKTQPEKEGCMEAEPTLTIGNIPQIESGNYICAITNQNNLAQIKIEEVNLTGQDQKWIDLSFSTWE
jgi:hypothetical protein